MEEKEVVVVLDFGGQYTHLIARRVREQGVYSEILPYDVELSTLMSFNPKGVILSGGPASVYTEDAPRCDKRVLELGIPVLGICYGHQLIAFLMGGEVGRGKKREYGRVTLYVDDENDLFKGFGKREVVWMSHGDQVLRLPPGFKVLAHTDYTPIASYKHEKRPIYGVQFHPEVSHTEKGWLLFRNFLYRVCKCKGSWNMESFVEKAVREIKEKVKPSERVLCAVSGGVDSTTTAVLVHRAVGDRLTCIFVDHGFMRKGEPEAVVNLLRKLGIKVVYVDARNRFMRRLKGVKDPEEKRRIVGEEFIRVFEEEARKL